MRVRSLQLLTVLCLATLGLLASLLAPSTPVSASHGATQPNIVASAVNDPGNYADHELLKTLNDADLLSLWLEVAPVTESAALLEVDGGATYDESRTALITDIGHLVERGETIEERSARLAEAADKTRILVDLSTVFVADALIATDGTESSSIRTDAAATMAELDNALPSERTSGFSLDDIALISYKIDWARGELADALTSVGQTSGTTSELAQARNLLAEILADVARIDESIAEQAAATAELQTEQDDAFVSVREQMVNLHNRRMLVPTFVGGLPLVTLDAYVRGATYAPDGCSVDWQLLAGIGRIESRHGTMNDSSVQASGKLSVSIYGPLLDGGATAAEAEAAARQAEEAALAALEAEAAEVERIAKEREEHFNSLVWGEEPDDPEPDNVDGDQDGEPEDSVAEASIFDPDLWGEQPGNDATSSDDDDDAEGDGEEDDENAVLTGNGFAVIEDTDNGSLDGNDRWDRAVGPMQFIPETWGYWETDGNGDGWQDPQNLYDATASAARFLCKLQQTRGSSPYEFVLGYNSSDTYVNNVMDVANSFETIDLPTIGDD